MFELLLQADRALADGALDQAERTYSQLVELDPTNAIAVAGLARVSLERGDEQAARSFADRALGIDPDSIAARRVLETLAHEESGHAAPEPAELPLLAAQRLEAISRKRGMKAASAATADDATAPKKARPKAAISKAGQRPTTEARPVSTSTPQAAGAGREPRGRARPDQIAPLPSEPLRERRQAGRLAAAAAAAAAAAREPVHPRHQPHHAMPVGRHHFEPEALKTPPSDAFSEAEMAAAVEAVDALDVTSPDTEDESVALRIALVADSTGLGAAEPEADFANADAADAAEAAAVSEAVREVAGPAAEMETEPAPERRRFSRPSGEEPSEEDAEAQALREAMAIVLEGEGQVGDAAAPASPREPSESPEPSEPSAGPESPHAKKGLFHRIRGN